jgi:N utilization substance protein B
MESPESSPEGLVTSTESGDSLAKSRIIELFWENFHPDKDPENSLELSSADFEAAWPMACELFYGVKDNEELLDKKIKKASANWRLERMGRIDRAIIRLAYFEMLFRPDIPPKVSLNEAIMMAKNFGDDEAYSFVNGVLNKLYLELQE